jgi:putative addiction module component (TIGR02574 family)
MGLNILRVRVFLVPVAYTFAMTERSIKLLQQVLSLTQTERADLAASLLTSLGAPPNADAEALWQEEISRRASDLESSSAKTIPWQEIHAQVSSALQRARKRR